MKLVRKTLLALIVVLASVKFGPSGTVFNTEVEVTLKLPVKPDSNNLAVFYHNEEDIWEYVTDASLDDDKATFKITHFSEYIIKDDITSETLDKFEYFVEQANLSGQSDKWILDSFVDYLINEAHVMDYVKRFGNYYYSAENILVAGLYHYNDKEGDPNDLIWYSGDRIYGISSQSTDRNTAVNAGNNYVENTLLTDITIVLEYVMITPSIEGIISEKVNFDLFPVPPEYFRVSPQICGDVKVDLKYNFTGHLKENAGQVSGKIFYFRYYS